MGFQRNTFSYTILLKPTSLNLNMHRFTVFTVLAAVAMLSEAAPGGGYYSRKSYKKPCKNLVDVAAGDARFSILVAVLKDLGLVNALRNIPAATVFAPTDDAFNKIAAVLPTLSKADKLKIVKRHVIPNKTIKAAAVPASASVATLGGTKRNPVKIDVVKDAEGVGVSFNGGARSNVVIPDVLACNGVIHAIDSVIL